MKRWAWLAAATALVAFGCSGCGKGGTSGGGSAEARRDLQPVPEAPKVEVQQESLPGASGDLAVVVARPQGEQRGEIRPTVTFNKPVKSLAMVEAQKAEDRAAPIAKIDPPLEGEWKWLGSASVEFAPKGLVPYGTPFKVTVFKGLKALDGSTLAEDYAFEFSTPRLDLQDVSPSRDDRWLKPDAHVKLLFNQPVKNEDLEALGFEVGPDHHKLPVKVVKRTSIPDENRAAEEKAGRHSARQSYEEMGFKNQQTRYELAPESAFPLDSDVVLTLPATLHGEQGPLALESAQTLHWRTYGPLRLTNVRLCDENSSRCPYGPFLISSTNQLDPKSLQGKVTTTPDVAIAWDDVDAYRGWGNHPPTTRITGKYRPGTAYKIEIAAGVKDEFGQVYDQPLSASGRTDDLEPALRTGGSVAVVEAAQGGKLPIELVNLQSLDVRAWKLSPSEMAQLLIGHKEQDAILSGHAPELTESVPLKYPRNSARVHGLDLSQLLGGTTGFAYVRVSSPQLHTNEGNPGPYNVVAQLTDLAVHTKFGPKSALAWVTQMSTGAPVANAEVELLDENGQSRWKGKSDANGIADIPGAVALGFESSKNSWEHPTVVITAREGTDVAATSSSWSMGVEPYEFGLSQGWEGNRPESQGFVFTDRGIYRPGDTVYVKGVVRYRVVGELKTPPSGTRLTATLTDSKGEKVLSKQVSLSKFGTFSLEAAIPKDAPTGTFQIEASGGVENGTVELSGNFRVEEYRAPQFRVDVDTDNKSVIAGDPVNAQVIARYLFGGAMADAKVKWSVNSSSTSFTPDSAPGFFFSQETWWWDDNHPRPSNGFVASGEGTTDAKGALAIQAGTATAPGEQPWSYTVEAEVTDVNRQAVAGRTAFTVHPASYYVGLHAPAEFPTIGKAFNLDAVVVAADGKRAPGRRFTVDLVSRTWKSVRQKDASGGFTTLSEPVEEKVQSCNLTSANEAVSCTVTPKAPGFLIARATVEDDQKRKHTASIGVYVIGQGFVAWQRNDTDRIDLLADKPVYNVGDTAKVLIKSPYPEANALITVEREGVFSRRVMKLVGSVQTVEIPITEDMVPDVYAGVLLMRPRVKEGGIETGEDPGRPNARVGLIHLTVEKKVKHLAVSVKPERPEYRPGEEVNVALEVKDSAGRPAPAELTVFAVDEAVLRLTDYQTPDPLAAIFPDRPLSVQLGEPLLQLVRRRSFGEKGEDQGGGGGGGEGKGFRSNFKTTVIFAPSVIAGADGKASVAFKLPDNLTTFRVMAVAVTQGDRFGSGDSSVKVNKPLLVLPALPRFARIGDKFEAGVVVHSYHGAPGEVTVTAEAENAQLTGPSTQTVSVTDEAPREVRFAFTAGKEGKATFRFKAVRGQDSDGVQETIPIELPVAFEAVATYGDTTDQRMEGIAPPSGVWPGLGGMDVTMTSTALGNFQQGFRQLVDYPYGCLEQQSSRLIPFVALRDIATKFGLPWAGPDDKKQEHLRELSAFYSRFLGGAALDVTGMTNPDQVIAATIKSISQLQDSSGGFRYWSNDTCPSSYASAYATLALFRAQQVGFDVPAETLNNAQAFLTRVAGGSCPCEHICGDDTRVFATYVLARTGRPKPSYYGQFFDKRKDLSLFSQALLADAMFTGGGNREQAKKLLQEILNHAKESAKGVHFEEFNSATYATLWQSDTRTTGVVLQTLTDIAPDHPYVSKIANYLTEVRQKNGEYRSTQEAAFSLMALTELLKTKEKDTPDFTAKLLMNGQPLMEEAFRGRTMEVKSKHLSIDALTQKSGGKEQSLSFRKEGAGVLYYSALLEYAPSELPKNQLDRGLFVQRWFEPYQGGGQTTKFYAGDLVRVRLRVATNQERHYAAFEIPLPAGLEPVDTSLATTAQNVRSATEEGPGAGYQNDADEENEEGSAEEPESEDSADLGPWAYSFWSPFNHVEQRDSKVVLFADHLPPGVHVASFVARATTPGTFLLKPASGALMYEPEVFGRSEGGTFEVVLPPPVASK